MKSLFLLRHAKAISGELSLPDHDRPLSDRGFKDSQYLAAKLSKKNIDFDLFLTSHAIRAIISDGCTIRQSILEDTVVGIRSRIGTGCQIRPVKCPDRTDILPIPIMDEGGHLLALDGGR